MCPRSSDMKVNPMAAVRITRVKGQSWPRSWAALLGASSGCLRLHEGFYDATIRRISRIQVCWNHRWSTKGKSNRLTEYGYRFRRCSSCGAPQEARPEHLRAAVSLGARAGSAAETSRKLWHTASGRYWYRNHPSVLGCSADRRVVTSASVDRSDRGRPDPAGTSSFENPLANFVVLSYCLLKCADPASDGRGSMGGDQPWKTSWMT